MGNHQSSFLVASMQPKSWWMMPMSMKHKESKTKRKIQWLQLTKPYLSTMLLSFSRTTFFVVWNVKPPEFEPIMRGKTRKEGLEHVCKTAHHSTDLSAG